MITHGRYDLHAVHLVLEGPFHSQNFLPWISVQLLKITLTWRLTKTTSNCLGKLHPSGYDLFTLPLLRPRLTTP